jgi:glutathione S-transferase
MALEIYYISGSPFAWRAMLALSLKGLTFKAHRLDPSKGENKTPEYLAMNPHGKVPVLKDGDLTLYESTAILAYLERSYPEVPLFGHTAIDGALIWQRTMEVENLLVPILGNVALPVFRGTVDGSEDGINEGLLNLKAELNRYSAWLEDNDFMAGPSVSAADITLYPALAMLARIASTFDAEKISADFLPLESNFPEVAAWMRRVEALDGFDAVYPPHWREQKAA